MKGNMMTFPLELSEVRKDEKMLDDKYLYPIEVRDIQLEIEELCDKMEYDGSIMFDECPDKVCIERMVKNLCEKEELSSCCTSNDKKMFNSLVQVMLCSEMRCRRNRRMCHKDRLSSC